MNFDGIWEGMVTFFFVALAIAFLLGIAACWIFPKLWAWLSPIIHTATA